MSVARPQSRSSGRPKRRSSSRPHTRSTGTRVVLVIALFACALLAGVQPAQADIGETIILRCTHNESLSGFSQSDYDKALAELSADTEEYSDCASRIREAQVAAAAGRGGGGGASPGAGATVATPATPAEQRSITHAQSAGSEPVKLGGGQVIHPGVVHVDAASALSSLPTPVLALLAFLLAGLLVAAGGVLRKHVRGRPD
jgi:hypothetical protein